MLEKIPDNIARKIEFASKYKFKGHISVTTIYKWLDNFKDEEFKTAIKILEQLEYFSSTDLSAIIKSHLDPFLAPTNKFNKGTCLHFIPIGKAGKSGFVILYLIKNLFKENIYAKGLQPPKFYYKASEIDIEKLNKNDIIIFVDDIIGSGDTFLSAVCTKEQKEHLGINTIPLNNEKEVELCLPDKIFNVAILSCIIMERAKKKINRVFPHINIMGETRNRLFEKGKSPLHSYMTILETRSLAYEYGKKLVDDKNKILGYGNSQAMIIFEHATPNNTLPIIWKGCNNEDFKWYPLRARSHRDRISYAIDNREYNTRWLLSLSELFDVEPEEIRGSNLVSPDNYDIALVLRLIRIGLSDLEIAMTLGVPLNKFNSIKEKGIERGLWDSNLCLSDLAKKTLTETEKYLSLFPMSDKEKDIYDDRDLIFIPETFGGIS